MKNKSFRWFLPVLAFVLLWPWNTQSKSQSIEQALGQKVKSFELANSSLPIALQRLATKYHLLVGFESLPQLDGEPALSLNVKVEDGTVRGVLDALITKDPRYVWVPSSETVAVYPTTGRDNLMQTVITRFKVDKVDRNEAVDALLNAPELQPALRQNKIKRREIMSLPGDTTKDLTRFSLDLRQATAREVLNAIANASHSSFWSFHRYGEQNQYFSIRVR